MATRILLVEDEEKVSRFIQKGLEAERFHVTPVFDGKKGETEARSGNYDLVILDVLLPVRNGFEVLQALRNQKVDTPVLMLTARGTTEDVVHGLDLGADDYLTKPFAFDELLARIRSVLRRRAKSSTVLRVGDLHLDTVAHKATRGSEFIDLTSREYALLDVLMRSPGRLFSRQELAHQVWGYNFDPGTNIIDVYVNHLRRKIDSPGARKLLHTIRGKGYALTEDPSGVESP